MTTPSTTIEKLSEHVLEFVKERDWLQFHAPKNLAMALSVEASELVELFQWMSEEESRSLNPEKRSSAEEEIGDVLIYLVRLCQELGIDLLAAAASKLEINRQKYPAERVRGSAKKYDEYR
jgi:NTP pyrophosphatase (non-canonical NTP hydrolase)